MYSGHVRLRGVRRERRRGDDLLERAAAGARRSRGPQRVRRDGRRGRQALRSRHGHGEHQVHGTGPYGRAQPAADRLLQSVHPVHQTSHLVTEQN